MHYKGCPIIEAAPHVKSMGQRSRYQVRGYKKRYYADKIQPLGIKWLAKTSKVML